MRAILLRKSGPPSRLTVAECPTPAPQGDEVRVRVRVIGVNYAETLSRRGLYQWAPPRPYIPGMEAYGEVEAIGPEARHRRIGDRVMVGAQHGCYAEQVCVSEHQAFPAFAGFSPEESAAFPVNYFTAWVALVEMARLRSGDRVLIHSAAGGVGTAAVQIAKRFGCVVYGTASTDVKLALLRRLGVDLAVNYVDRDFEAEIRAATGGAGVDVVLELVGGEVFRKSVALLAPLGRVVVAGVAGIELQKWNLLSWWRAWRFLPKADVRDLAVRSHGLLATHVGYLLPHRERLIHLWAALASFVQQHGVRPVVGTVLDGLPEIAHAHALMESRRSLGKIVVRLS